MGKRHSGCLKFKMQGEDVRLMVRYELKLMGDEWKSVESPCKGS